MTTFVRSDRVTTNVSPVRAYVAKLFAWVYVWYTRGGIVISATVSLAEIFRVSDVVGYTVSEVIEYAHG